MSKRAIWDMTIVLAGVGYIIIVLSENIQSSAFAVLFIMVAGYEMIEAHAEEAKSTRSSIFSSSRSAVSRWTAIG